MSFDHLFMELVLPEATCWCCGNLAYVEDAGRGRYFWRCETCQYESSNISLEKVWSVWADINAEMWKNRTATLEHMNKKEKTEDELSK